MGCVGDIVNLFHGSQELWRTGFKFDPVTKSCSIGQLPYEAVRIWKEMGENSQPSQDSTAIYICTSCLKGRNQLCLNPLDLQ